MAYQYFLLSASSHVTLVYAVNRRDGRVARDLGKQVPMFHSYVDAALKLTTLQKVLKHLKLKLIACYLSSMFMVVYFLKIKAILFFFGGFIIIVFLHRSCIFCCQFSVSKPAFIGLSSKTIGHEHGIPRFWCVTQFTWKTSPY